MIIGIDGNEANVEKKVGISEYAGKLLWEFSKLRTQNAKLKIKVFLKDSPRDDMPKPDGQWEYKIVKPAKLWTQIGLPIDLFVSHQKPDVFFTPTHYAPRFSPVPSVISIMDLSYIHYPELFDKKDLYQLKNWTKYSVKNAAKIITISQCSKNDIMKYYSVPSDKIEVIYPGIKEITEQKVAMSEILEKHSIKGKFILFVSTLQPRKNIVRLIQAHAKIVQKEEFENLKLVVIGKKGWLFEEILEAPKKFGVEESVLFLDYVTDAELPTFYKKAECFVFPSLYEGFGLPVLEAMKFGCPVVASNVSSIPEAGGDAAVYFDPENVDEIAEKIMTVVSNSKKREDMIEKGYEQVKKFSWEKSAEKTLDVLMKLAEKN